MENIVYLGCGLLGVFGHCLFKLDSLKKSSKAANLSFSIANYLNEDMFAILFSIVAVFIWFFVFAETVEQYPKLANYARISFITAGWMGSYIIQYFFSSAQKRITTIIDEKTNKADNI